MADRTDLIKLLNDFQDKMASNTDIVDRLNERLKKQYNDDRTPQDERRLYSTSESSIKDIARLVRNVTARAITSSPELEAEFIKEIGDKRIEKLAITKDDGLSAGAYDRQNKVMMINPVKALTAARPDIPDSRPLFDRPSFKDIIGTIGHELDHSQNRAKNIDERYDYEIKLIAVQRDKSQPHDYTKAIGDRLAIRSASEARAELDYYNSIVLSMIKEDPNNAKKVPSVEEVFSVMSKNSSLSFFEKDGKKLLPGLTVDPNSGLLPQTEENIKVLKQSYFERPQFDGKSYKDHEIADLVKGVLDFDPAKDIGVNFKALGVSYKVIQPLLKDISPPRTFYDYSGGVKIKVETDKPLAAPVKDAPVKGEPIVPKGTNSGEKSNVPGTAKKSPLLSENTHPDHPLYTQAVAKLEQLGPQAFASRQQLENAAGSLVSEAKGSGMQRIDVVIQGKEGTSLFAVQGNPNDPASPRIYTDKSIAVERPLEQSSNALLQDVQGQQQEQQRARTSVIC